MKQKGFTLIEIMVVLSIIILLSGFILTAVFNGRSQARDQARIADVQQFKIGLKLYKEGNGSYPDYAAGTEIGTGGAIDDLLKPYVPDFHGDPLGGSDFVYMYDSDFSCNGVSVIAVYAKKLEDPKYINADKVCNLDPDFDPYHIVVVSVPN